MPKKGKKKTTYPKNYIENGEGLRVTDVPGKGKGVIADTELPPNTRIRYKGKEINETTYDELVKQSHEDASVGYVNYIMAAGKNKYLDAHPRHPGSDSWIAGRFNEPASKQKANMITVMEQGGPTLVTVRKIKAGEELTFKYDGNDYVRMYNGKKYKVGQKATRPNWLK